MIEVFSNLFVGSDLDYQINRESMQLIIHAAKYPYYECNEKLDFRNAGSILVGNEWALNLIDAEQDFAYSKNIFDKMHIILDVNAPERKLLHCNRGLSRSPAIAFSYLFKTGVLNSEDEFRKIYPKYRPSQGIRNFLERYLNAN